MELFGGMTVRDHLIVAGRSRLGTGRLWKDCLNLARPSPDEVAATEKTLGLLGLEDVADHPIESLSLGRTRLVELGRALMTEPRLMLLDEPSSGLDQHETRDLVRTLRDVQRERGTAILLVEHDVEMVSAFTDRVFVLDFGTLIAQGATAEVMSDDAVRKAYLGEIDHVDEVVPAVRATAARTNGEPPAEPAAPVLELRDVEAGYGPFRALFGVSFSVPQGHVVALLGANGAGKTTIARLVSGLIPLTGGAVLFDGVDISRMKPWRIAPLGIVQAPEGRSVFSTLTVEENLTLDFRRNLGRRGVAAGLERAYELFPRLGERRRQLAGNLSGGEQRMLSLARVLVRPPRLLVVDELSLGLAPIAIDDGLRDPRAGAPGGDHAAPDRAVRRPCLARRRLGRAVAARRGDVRRLGRRARRRRGAADADRPERPVSDHVERFEIRVDDAVLEDLRQRLVATRLPDQIDGTGWEYGVPADYLRELVDHWRDGYDWRVAEARLNELEHFRTSIDGQSIHFVHARSAHDGAQPLLLTHGWPGSIVEFLDVIPRLTTPEAYGGEAADAFHVVAPSLPGYGFSELTRTRGWDVSRIARAFIALMARLGYDRYGAQGGDWGAQVATRIGALDSEHCVGIHLNMPLADPPTDPVELSEADQADLQALRQFRLEESAYALEQGTKPQTLGAALNDSPVGLLAWIVEKFRSWSDCDGDPERVVHTGPAAHQCDRVLGHRDDHVLHAPLLGAPARGCGRPAAGLRRRAHRRRALPQGAAAASRARGSSVSTASRTGPRCRAVATSRQWSSRSCSPTTFGPSSGRCAR